MIERLYRLIYLSSEDRYEEIANGPRQWCGWLNFVIGRK